MHRLRIGAAALGAALLLVAAAVAPAAADCLADDEPQAQTVEGVIDAVPGAGRVAVRVMFVSIGFDHHAGRVEVRWTAAGDARRQVLFHGVHDRPPVRVVRTRGGLAVSAQYCPTGSDVCETRTARFVYDPAAGRFRAANAEARRALSGGCTGD
jgi:hypothetical protein